MTLVKGSADHKQHLNLSSHAHTIVMNDMFAFSHNDSLSGFINTVFRCYFEYADASISMALARKEEELRNMLKSAASGSSLEKVLESLLKKKEKELIQRASSYGSGCILKIRLNNENFAYLYPDDQPDPDCFHFPEDCYYKNVGQYLKAVIEEYASKSFFEREEIFYRDVLQLIENCTKNGTLMRLHFQNGAYDMKPYGILGDREQKYHYLVGMSTPIRAGAEQERITSVRLSQILSVQTRSYRSGKLTQAQKKEIQHLIRTAGVQFVSQEESEEIVVYLTREGIRKYRKMLHLRPLLVKSEDYEDHSIYYFHCTQLQARFYLFRLGGDSYVLKPAALREALKERFEAAVDMYGKELHEVLPQNADFDG